MTDYLTVPRPLDLAGCSPCWATTRSALMALLEAEGASAPVQAAAPRPVGLGSLASVGPVALVPVYGLLTPRPTWLGSLMGWTSAADIQAAVTAALASEDVRAIVLDVDSPGGNVHGVLELADFLASVRGRKPIIAVANAVAASAAYWIASQADKVYVTPSGEVGSIGVLSIRPDTSRADEREGIRYTIISSGRYKAEGIPVKPASVDELAHLQARADEYYKVFVEHVARGRGTTPQVVASGYGEGRMMGAAAAVRAGLADAIGSLNEVFSEVSMRHSRSPRVRERNIRIAQASLGRHAAAAGRAAARARWIDLLEKM